MRMDFTHENKVNQYDGYPLLKLEAKESARVAVLESPMLVYKHTLRKPVIDPQTGEIAKETRKGKNGDYEVDSYEFVGTYVCTGIVETVYNDPDHIDPDNCLLCKAVTQYAGKFEAPKPYYMVHAIRYKIKQGTLTPQEPFQVELVLWSLPGTNFNALTDIAEEHGDVRKVDLLLTDCTNKTYQNYKIGAGSAAYWVADPSRQATVMEIFKNNKADDATIKKSAGKPQTPVAVQNDIGTIMERWSLHGKIGAAQPMNSGEFGGQIAAGNLAAAQAETPAWNFDAPAAQAPATSPVPATADGGLPDFLGGPTEAPAAPQPAAEAPQAAPVADTPVAEQGAQGGEFSFDDLMKL